MGLAIGGGFNQFFEKGLPPKLGESMIQRDLRKRICLFVPLFDIDASVVC